MEKENVNFFILYEGRDDRVHSLGSIHSHFMLLGNPSTFFKENFSIPWKGRGFDQFVHHQAKVFHCVW